MAHFISKQFSFNENTDSDEITNAYINDKGNIFIASADDQYHCVCIPKEDWSHLVKFINKQLKEYGGE
jgi:hypothetical protein